MNIIVCVKQVPDTNEVKIDPVKGTLIREGVPSILNPDDAAALEAALSIKDRIPDTKVTLITMGPPQASYMLRECLAMGGDEAYLLSDRAFGGADTCATSTTLAAGIKKIKDFDIVFAGRQAIDGDTAQVGPQTAQRLEIPSVTYVEEIEIEKKVLKVKRQLEDGYEMLEVKMPCLLTVIKEMNEPRYMTVNGVVSAYKKDITVWNHNDIELDEEFCGLKASPTKVFRSFTPPKKCKGEILNLTIKENATTLIEKLDKMYQIKRGDNNGKNYF